jgi:sugar fermentation stimulation protein A
MDGAYILLVDLEDEVEVTVGRLGPLRLRPGRYAYVGSARRGLKGRVRRHLRKAKRVRWHIDYLTLAAQRVHAILIPARDPPECFLGRSLQRIAEGVVKGFGAGDCSCPSHLAYLGEVSTLRNHSAGTWCSSPQRSGGSRTQDTRD